METPWYKKWWAIAFFIFVGVAILNGILSTTPQKPVTKQPVKQVQAEMTPSQHLTAAKKALADGYKPDKDPMKTTWGNITQAEEHLKAIKKYDNDEEKKESQKLWDEIERRKKEINRLAKILAKKLMIQQRASFREKLDEIFLKSGMDVNVVLEGTEKDILRLEYVLWSRPSMYKFTNGGDMNEGSFLSNLKKAGFKRVYFDNKYNFNSYYDLSKYL